MTIVSNYNKKEINELAHGVLHASHYEFESSNS